MGNNLYEVDVRFVYYALAQNSCDAMAMAGLAFNDLGSRGSFAYMLDDVIGDRLEPKWHGDQIVYGGNKPTTLDEARIERGLMRVDDACANSRKERKRNKEAAQANDRALIERLRAAGAGRVVWHVMDNANWSVYTSRPDWKEKDAREWLADFTVKHPDLCEGRDLAVESHVVHTETEMRCLEAAAAIERLLDGK